MLENVPGMVYWKQGEFGATVLEEFGKIGYAVSKKILLAADYGVPQRRRRLFIVGMLGDEPFQFPEPTHLGGWRRDYLDLWEKRRKERGLLRHVRSWEAIGDLPDVSSHGDVTANPDPGRLTPFARRMRGRRQSGVITGHAAFLIPADHLEPRAAGRYVARYSAPPLARSLPGDAPHRQHEPLRASCSGPSGLHDHDTIQQRHHWLFHPSLPRPGPERA